MGIQSKEVIISSQKIALHIIVTDEEKGELLYCEIDTQFRRKASLKTLDRRPHFEKNSKKIVCFFEVKIPISELPRFNAFLDSFCQQHKFQLGGEKLVKLI